MPWDGVLVRFGEIGIKSAPVRSRMLERLRQNLLDGLLRSGVEGDVQRMGSRLWMVGPDVDALLDVATHAFGVVSASPVRRVDASIESIGAAAAELALEREWSTFAVRASRTGEHAFTSQDLGRDVGSAVWEAAEKAGRTPKVDLSDPDLEVHLDVRDQTAYVFTASHAGPGGLPMGSQGKVLALLSDPASCVAAWLMMRRGCRVVPVHAGHAQSLPMDNLEALQAWGLSKEVDLLPVCTGFTRKSVLLETVADLARRTRCDAIVTGDTLLSDLAVPPGDVPVLRPVCGLAETEVASLMDRIGLDGEEEPEHIFDDTATESVESLLSMHRVIEVG